METPAEKPTEPPQLPPLRFRLEDPPGALVLIHHRAKILHLHLSKPAVVQFAHQLLQAAAEMPVDGILQLKLGGEMLAANEIQPAIQVRPLVIPLGPPS
jgi:hypothetical protein